MISLQVELGATEAVQQHFSRHVVAGKPVSQRKLDFEHARSVIVGTALSALFLTRTQTTMAERMYGRGNRRLLLCVKIPEHSPREYQAKF